MELKRCMNEMYLKHIVTCEGCQFDHVSYNESFNIDDAFDLIWKCQYCDSDICEECSNQCDKCTLQYCDSCLKDHECKENEDNSE